MKKSTVMFVLVFMSGVICANILGIASGRELGAMSEYFINRYMYTDIQGKELFLFLFYERVPKMLALLFLSIGIYGIIIFVGYVCYIAFSAGFLSVIGIMNYGIKGIFLIAGFYFPQWLFYVPVLMIWYYELKKFKNNEKKHLIRYVISFLFVCILFFLGLCMESYVNPYLLQKIIGIL